MIEVKDVGYSYRNRYQTTEALRGVTCRFESGQMYAITGPSGSGKTTLLSLLAGLDLPARGSISVDGRDLSRLDRDRYRREELSIVYQSFNLFPLLTAQENVAFPLELKKTPRREALAEAAGYLAEVGLPEEIRSKRPLMMSGGEQQRVAIARALAAGGGTILADEPTGNLDTENGRLVIGLLKRLAHEKGRTVIVITHNPEIAAEADAVYMLADGRLRGGEEAPPCA